LITSIPDALAAAGLPVQVLSGAVARIPLASAGFSWILPTFVGALVGWIVAQRGVGGKIEKPGEHDLTDSEEQR
jgi:branched-subunit amino acid permease